MHLLPARTRTALAAGAVLGVLVCVAAVVLTPPDAKLGVMVRFVMFHGASTWVNMATFTLAGAFGIAVLLGHEGARRWDEALRWVSLPLWCVNSVLGLLSMQLIWGGVLWSEPRLRMTFGVLGGALVIFAAQMLFASPKVTAALDAVLAIALWTFVLVLPNLFHPDSPVFQSGNWEYIGTFLGMVAGVGLAVGCIATLVARRDGSNAAAE